MAHVVSRIVQRVSLNMSGHDDNAQSQKPGKKSRQFGRRRMGGCDRACGHLYLLAALPDGG